MSAPATVTPAEIEALRAELEALRAEIAAVAPLLRAVIKRNPSKRHAPPDRKLAGVLTEEQEREIDRRMREEPRRRRKP